jgi:hypothetical protein
MYFSVERRTRTFSLGQFGCWLLFLDHSPAWHSRFGPIFHFIKSVQHQNPLRYTGLESGTNLEFQNRSLQGG